MMLFFYYELGFETSGCIIPIECSQQDQGKAPTRAALASKVVGQHSIEEPRLPTIVPPSCW